MTAPVDFLEDQQEDEARQKQDSYYEKLSTDPAFFDSQMKDPVIEAAEKYHPMPQTVKSSVAAQGWLSFQMNQDLDGPAYTAARDAYSNQFFGKAATTDDEFWKQIGEDYKLRQERRGALTELHGKVVKKVFEDTVKGETPNIASIFSPWHEKHIDLVDKEGDYLSSAMELANRTKADIERFREPAARVANILLQTGGNPTDEDITAMSSQLAALPYEDRQDLYRYARTAAEFADPKDPGNPLSVIATQNWKAMERSGAQVYGALGKPAIQGTMPLDEIERAAIKIRDNLIKNGGSPEEIAVQQGRIDQVAVARELKDLAQNGIDPIKPVMPDTGWLSWGRAEKGLYMVAGSAPYLAMSALGGTGLILGGAAIADYEYERIRLQNPNIHPDAAHAIANASGAAQTFLMKWRADAFFARAPATAKVMEYLLPKVGSHGASRFLRGSTAAAIQGIGATEAQMGVSEFLPAVVSAFREDMPDADFGQIFGDLINVQPEVFWMNVPLALIGGGVGTWRDFKNPQAVINPKTLGYAGINEKGQARILSSPEAIVDSVIREEMGKRTPGNIARGIKAATADIASAKDYNEGPDTPTVEYAPKPDGTDFFHVKDPEGAVILSTENIDTAIAAVTDFHQQKLAGEENQVQRAKAEGAFEITREELQAQEIRGQNQPDPETLQHFIEQQQMTGFRELDTIMERIQQMPPEQREVAVEKARKWMADIELRASKLQQLGVQRKAVSVDKIQRSIEKAIRAGRDDMVAALQQRMADTLIRQTPGEAGRAMQQEIVSNLGRLEAIVSMLPVEARGRIGGYSSLAALRTPEKRLQFLSERLNKVSAVFEKHLRTFYGDKIATILEQHKPSGKVPKSKVGVEAQRDVDTIRRVSELNADQTEKAMRAIEAELQVTGREAPESDAMVDLVIQWDTLHRWGDLGNRTAAELSQNYRDLKNIAVAGREQIKVIEEARRAEVAGRVAEVLGKMEAPTPEAILAWQMMSEGEQFGDFLREMQISHKSFLQVLERVFPDVSWVRPLEDQIRHADNATIDHVIGVQAQMDAALAPIVGNMSWNEQHAALRGLREKIKGQIHIVVGRKTVTQRIEILKARDIIDGIADPGNLSEGDIARMADEVAALPKGTRKEFIEFERVESEGKRTALTLDKEHMIQAILSWGDSNLRGKMEASGYSQESIAEMQAIIAGDELAQGLLDFGREFYRADYDVWNQTYRKMMYMDMLRHEGYAPGRFVNTQGEDMMMGLSPFGGPVETTGFLPGALKTRVDHNAMFRPTSFTKTFWEHVYQRAHWTSWAEVNREIYGVIGNKDVQMALSAKLGPAGLRLINNWMKVLSNTGNQKAIEVGFMNHIIDKFMSATAIKALSGSWKVMVNQTDSATRFTWAMTPAEIAKALADPRLTENYDAVWASPTIQRRIAEGANPAVRHLFQKQRITPSMLLDLSKRGLVPMQWFDAQMTSRSANVVYTFELAKNLEAGLPRNQAEALALDRMDEVVYRYSQPMGVANKSLPEVSGNRYMKMWMMFQAEQRLQTALVTEALGQAGRGGANRAKAYNRVAAIYGTKFLSTMVLAAFRDLTTDAPSEDIWSWESILAGTLLGPIKGYFLVGTAVDGISAWLSGERMHESSPNPMTQWAAHVKYATTHIDDLFFNDDNPDKFWSEVNHLAQATAIWGPATGVPAMFYNLIRPVIGGMKEEKPSREQE